jgi:hypothetical protein
VASNGFIFGGAAKVATGSDSPGTAGGVGLYMQDDSVAVNYGQVVRGPGGRGWPAQRPAPAVILQILTVMEARVVRAALARSSRASAASVVVDRYLAAPEAMAARATMSAMAVTEVKAALASSSMTAVSSMAWSTVAPAERVGRDPCHSALAASAGTAR